MREHALSIFQAAVQAVQPQYLLPQHIKGDGGVLQLGEQRFLRNKVRNIYVIGAGKAAAAMARETEKILGENIAEGIVVTKYDHALPLQYIRCVEAGHPLPDEAGIKAGEEITALLKKAGEHDVVIALVSGGASALLVDCPPGVILSEVQQVFAELLACGAVIGEMNIVRKHLSPGIKGGQLVRTAFPATVVSFILSDVPGDQLDIIASGPTVADTSSFSDAWNILEKYKLIDSLPASIAVWLKQGVKGEIADTPRPGDSIFEKSFNYLIGTNQVALNAAAVMARQLGYHTLIVDYTLSGEAREEAKHLLQKIAAYGGPKPACLLIGGESTVTIKGSGTGGRNQELALAALDLLMNEDDTIPVILAAGTDGTDGPTNAAGAVIDNTSRQSNLDTQQYLNNNNSYNFFKQAGGHIITGPTQTNVMDVVVVLINATPTSTQ